MVVLEPGSPAVFPDPNGADSEGLVAIGGDLSPERLVAAYRAGVFPWYDEAVPPLWWSPDPRAVLVPSDLHEPRRQARTRRRRLREGELRVTFNQAFAEVMVACASERSDGVWILPEMVDAYTQLHRLGYAHSVEVWNRDGALVGGLYGVQSGALFAAESKFHRETDASKVALVVGVRELAARGIELVDVQLETEHLSRFGGVDVAAAALPGRDRKAGRAIGRLERSRGGQRSLRRRSGLIAPLFAMVVR